MVYFTSDLHFCHEKMIRIMDRPFRDAADMEEGLIENWNSRVTPEDEVYILGDVTMRGRKEARRALERLNGRKYLVRGNHDGFADKLAPEENPLLWVRDYACVTWRGIPFVLFHYPIAEWDRKRYGAIHLHGHLHSRPEYNLEQRRLGLRRYDVGVDANGMAPVSAREIAAFFGVQPEEEQN